jgi:cytochrome bd-type quinol oxidase subunit 1
VHANQVIFSIILFFLIYLLLFVTFIYLLNRKIQHGPDDDDGHHDKAPEGFSAPFFLKKGRASSLD